MKSRPTAAMAILLMCAALAQPSDNPADTNRDGHVDWQDFVTFADNWLWTRPAEPNDMVLIPGGEFQVGDYFNDWPLSPNVEKPQHWVFIDAFLMARHELTNQQYVEFLNDALASNLIEVKNKLVFQRGTSTIYLATYEATHESCIAFAGSHFLSAPAYKANHPVVYVTWFGAAAYCNWRSEQWGKELCYDPNGLTPDLSRHGCRLPTEAEWEFAARGGLVNKRFAWGDTITHDQANYYSTANDPYDLSTTRNYHPTYGVGDMPYTAPVGSFTPSGYGLYDIVGNVLEWCNDWWQSDYYTSSPYYNPPGPTSGTERVFRGGSWASQAYGSRAAYRGHNSPWLNTNCVGFRVILDLE